MFNTLRLTIITINIIMAELSHKSLKITYILVKNKFNNYFIKGV